jgi:hypothetical protein
MSRVVEMDAAAEAFTAASWILSLPYNVDTDAVAVMCGLGEQERVVDAIRCRNYIAADYLFVTGVNKNERTFDPLTIERLMKEPYNLGSGDGVETQVYADHTKAQAEWLVEQVKKHDVSFMTLCVPPYHAVRAYLTVLRAMNLAGVRIQIFPNPTPIKPSYVVPETGADAMSMSAGEYPRIGKYQATGDVATLSELKEYLDWLWDQK